MAARISDTTAHGGVIVQGLPTVLIGTGAGFGPGPITMAQAAQLFAIMAAQGDIAFRYPVDGCYARAYLMMQRMQALGLDPHRVWSFASSSNDPLTVYTNNVPSGEVQWGYHVAPTIPVTQNDGSVQNMVVDPSMFDKPVTMQEWRDAQNDNPTLQQTAPGQPPPGKSGSGYWPGEDPAEGTDNHARETMDDYRRLQGGP